MTIHLGSFFLGALAGATAFVVTVTIFGLAVNARKAREGEARARAAAAAAVSGNLPIDDDLRRIQAERLESALERGRWE